MFEEDSQGETDPAAGVVMAGVLQLGVRLRLHFRAAEVRYRTLTRGRHRREGSVCMCLTCHNAGWKLGSRGRKLVFVRCAL